MRSIKLRRLLKALLVLFVAWIAYETYDAGRSSMMPPAPQPVIMDKGRAHGERLQTHSWAIEYDKIVGNSDQTILDLEGVHNGIFYKNGKPFLRLRAKHLTVNTVTHDMNAVGALHIETFDRKHFRALDTTAINWNQASKRLLLPSETKITGGKGAPPFIASRITIDTEKGAMHMEGVHGQVRP